MKSAESGQPREEAAKVDVERQADIHGVDGQAPRIEERPKHKTETAKEVIG
jgi:hypothetical protein